MSGEIRQPWEIVEDRLGKKIEDVRAEVSSIRQDFRNEGKDLQKTVQDLIAGQTESKKSSSLAWTVLIFLLACVVGSGGLAYYKLDGISQKLGALEERSVNQRTIIDKQTASIDGLAKSSDSLKGEVEAKLQQISADVKSANTTQAALDGRLTTIEKQNTALTTKVSELSSKFEEIIKQDEARTQAAIAAAQQAAREEMIDRTIGVLLTVNEVTAADPTRVMFQVKLPPEAGAEVGKIRECRISLTTVSDANELAAARAQKRLDVAVYDCQAEQTSQHAVVLKVAIRFPGKGGEEVNDFLNSKGQIIGKVNLRFSKTQP